MLFRATSMRKPQFYSSVCKETSHTAKTDECSNSDSVSTFGAFPTELSGKTVRFDCDEEGNAVCQFYEVESYREYEHLWWSPDRLSTIKERCNETAKKYSRNEEFCETIINLMMHALQGCETPEDFNNLVENMSNHSEARGLEPHIVTPCKKLLQIHYDAVLDAQQEAYDNGYYGSERANMAIWKASIETSRPFEILAIRQAQFDCREAMRASFSRWGPDPHGRRRQHSRRSSMSRITPDRSQSFSVPKQSRRISMSRAMPIRSQSFSVRKQGRRSSIF